MPRKSTKPAKTNDTSLGRQLLKELARTIYANEGNVTCKITKGEALVKGMANKALKGDQRMMGHILKIIDKLNPAPAKDEKPEEKLSETDEDIILRYYIKYKDVLEEEVQKRIKENPNKAR